MRIIYFSHTFFSDCDFPLLREIERNGHEVFAYYHLSGWELNAGLIEIKKQPTKDCIIKASQIPEMLVYKDFVNLDHIFFVNNPHSRRFHIQRRLIWLKMFFHMKKQKGDIVHITYHLNGWENILYCLNLPLVMTVHDPFMHSNKFSKSKEKKRIKCFTKSKHLILLNKAMIKDFSAYYNIPLSKISLSRLGDYSHVRYIHPEKVSFTNKPFILFFGLISKYKGIKYLVEAMKMVHDSHSNVDLVIIGRGQLDFDYSPYKDLDYIKFINRFATVSELSSLLQQCMFAVCPYTDATQSGVVQTALSAGCPLIVTNVGNMSEIVTHGVNGLVCKPSNSFNLAEKMNMLIQNPSVLSSFKKNINDIWLKDMSWNPVANDYINTYNSVLNDKTR